MASHEGNNTQGSVNQGDQDVELTPSPSSNEGSFLLDEYFVEDQLEQFLPEYYVIQDLPEVEVIGDVNGMLQEYLPEVPRVDSPPEYPPIHMWEELSINSKRFSTGVRCKNCLREHMRKECRWVCNTCPNRPGLCSQSCFDRWHSSDGFEAVPLLGGRQGLLPHALSRREMGSICRGCPSGSDQSSKSICINSLKTQLTLEIAIIQSGQQGPSTESPARRRRCLVESGLNLRRPQTPDTDTDTDSSE